MGSLRELLRNRALLVFMLGHFTVDMYGGILPVLYPLLANSFELDKASVGFVALAFTGAASVSQPLFGYVADRFGSRKLAAGSIVWSAAMIGVIGFAPNYALLLGIALLAGLGSGAYHPLGAANASLAADRSGTLRRNSALALYTVGGTGGYSLGPLIGAGLFILFGPSGTIAVLPFGLLVAWTLYRQLVSLQLGAPARRTSAENDASPIQWLPLALIMLVVMLRSWVFGSVISFIPLWFDEQGYSAVFYSVLTTLMLGIGAAGTLACGFAAERFGARRTLLISLFGSVPALVLFALFPGPQSLIFGPAFGFLADMGIAVTLGLAQRCLPGRVGMASGFILGLGFVTAGIGIPVTGFIADRIGMGDAFVWSSLLIVAAGVIVLLLPRRAVGSEVVVSRA